MQYPTQLLYDLRDTTAWISGQDLHKLFFSLVNNPCPCGFKEQFKYTQLNNLDKDAIKLLESDQFSVVKLNHENRWIVLDNDLSFLEAFELRNKVGRENSFVVPTIAAIIIYHQCFYKDDVEFSDGFMSIKDVNLLMCRWIEY